MKLMLTNYISYSERSCYVDAVIEISSLRMVKKNCLQIKLDKKRLYKITCYAFIQAKNYLNFQIYGQIYES